MTHDIHFKCINLRVIEIYFIFHMNYLKMNYFLYLYLNCFNLQTIQFCFFFNLNLFIILFKISSYHYQRINSNFHFLKYLIRIINILILIILIFIHLQHYFFNCCHFHHQMKIFHHINTHFKNYYYLNFLLPLFF